MKPLDLKIEWLRRIGYGVEQRGEALYIYVEGPSFRERVRNVPQARQWRALVLFGNPTYRRLREGLRAHLGGSQ
jgi:hypothetical protein